jgi:hypothetical protein
MACCETQRGGIAPAATDPASHVNFTKGMVLGVDDYRQEHAYLSGAIHWLARETLGYGVTTGLAVTIESGAEGPIVRVAAGAALLPSGRLVCVAGDQCARLNSWLQTAANAAAVERQLSGPASPPSSPPDAANITLYLILSHHKCLTLPVLIPGEPCRSEDELMAPSRVTDDYRLKLALSPPPMREHEAAMSFAAFMGSISIVATASSPVENWLRALEDWAGSLGFPEPPPSSPPSGPLEIASADWPAFHALALRFWASRVRPGAMARRCRSAGSSDDDRLLLARLEVPVIHAGTPPADQWQVDSGGGPVVVDEAVRATLPSLQLVSLMAAASRIVPAS